MSLPPRAWSAYQPRCKHVWRAFSLAGRLLHLRDRLDPAELLEWAIGETGYDAVLMAQRMASNRWRMWLSCSIWPVSSVAKGWLACTNLWPISANTSVTTPHAPEAQIMSEEEDVVRIMTIHQAKGLEFPAVFVPIWPMRGEANGQPRHLR